MEDSERLLDVSERLQHKLYKSKGSFYVKDFELETFITEKSRIVKNRIRKDKVKTEKVVFYETIPELIERISRKAKRKHWKIFQFETLLLPERGNSDTKYMNFALYNNGTQITGNQPIRQVIRVYYLKK